MRTLGNRIKELRQHSKLTQNELAKSLDVSVSTIRMLEKNERKPSINLLEKLSSFFHISTDILMFGEDELEELHIAGGKIVTERYNKKPDIVPEDAFDNTPTYEREKKFLNEIYPLSDKDLITDFDNDSEKGNLTRTLLVKLVATDLIASEKFIPENIMELLIAAVKIDAGVIFKLKCEAIYKDPHKYYPDLPPNF